MCTSMTVRVPSERSSRIYKGNVQYDDHTNKKTKCFFLHNAFTFSRPQTVGEEGIDRCKQTK